MNNYAFDPEAIVNMQSEGSMETHTTPIPEGLYPATIKTVQAKTGESQDKNTGETRHWAALTVQASVEVGPDVMEALGREPGSPNPVTSCMIFLDIDESGTGLAMGKNKNVKLGKLRDALGQNGPGAWTPSMMEGQPCKVQVGHRIQDGEIYDEIKKFLPL